MRSIERERSLAALRRISVSEKLVSHRNGPTVVAKMLLAMHFDGILQTKMEANACLELE